MEAHSEIMEADWGSSKYFQDNFIALGTLYSKVTEDLAFGSSSVEGWSELLNIIPSSSSQSGQYLNATTALDSDISRLLKEWRIKIFARVLNEVAVHRIYLRIREASRPSEDLLAPELAAQMKSLQIWPVNVLMRILPHINLSPHAWNGESETDFKPFDPWATAEDGSLFYIFNTLPSPSPDPRQITDLTDKEAVMNLLDFSKPVPGLKTQLYPYQARSAAQMIQKESCKTTRLDPRYEPRIGPDGNSYLYSPREASFCKNASMYDSTRGGILAETMGLGKTIICLAVILATRDSLPEVPPFYEYAPPDADSVPSLLHLALRSCGKHSIAVRPKLDRLQRLKGVEYSSILRHLEDNPPAYLIPGKPPRSLRKVTIPPPRKMTLSSATIIVVPRNLVHQWKAELRKHLSNGRNTLKVLIMDDPNEKMPPAEDLRRYDILLFSKPRFEREASDGLQLWHRREIVLGEDYRPVDFVSETYHSPLKSLHFLRIIIDEGHEFSSSNSNAVLVAEKIITAERRWVVSGTPAKDKLYGVEVDLAGAAEVDNFMDDEEDIVEDFTLRETYTPLGSDAFSLDSTRSLRLHELDRRKAYNLKEEVGTASAARNLGLLARHFLQVNPWCADNDDGLNSNDTLYRHGSVWDEHVYRHEHLTKKTYTSFSRCLRQTLQSLVIKTQPEDVERDIVLPPLYHKVVRLEPSFYDKLTANLFVLFLTANAVTSERTDVDYLFHKKSAKARYQLVNNLRQSNFFWTGFSNEDVESVLRIGTEYLKKEGINCTSEDRESLEVCLEFARMTSKSAAWSSMSNHHEVGLFLEQWPEEGMTWTMTTDSKPPMIGVTQLINAQNYVNDRLFTEKPLEGLESAGRELMVALEESNAKKNGRNNAVIIANIGVPKSGIKSEPLASKYRTVSPKKKIKSRDIEIQGSTDVIPLATPKNRKRKREETPEDTPASPQATKKMPPKSELDKKDLPSDSALLKPSVTGTVSAKLSYLIDRIVEFHAEEKIIVFYDGENAAFYLAQSLELLHVKFLIYSRTLSNVLRSKYVVTFDADPTIRVLLMDVRCGAYGLNVNKASRVFFINPVCRPSTEAQAIKRAHRIGQTKPVYVETLVLNGTIEAGMFERSRRMTQTEHLEALQLSDDKGVAEVIQSAKLLPVKLEDGEGLEQMAKLKESLQIFGRKGRGTMMKIKGIDKEEELDIFGEKRPAKRLKISSVGNTLTSKAGEASSKSKEEKSVPIGHVNGMSGVEWMNVPFLQEENKKNQMELEDSLFG